MKTKHFLTGLDILSMAFVVGCQKDDTTPSATEVSSQMSLEESKLKSLVTNFSNKINSEFKSSEIMSIDSAEWYIEAALNYTYSNSVSYESYITDSVKYVINDNENSSAIISDIADAYNHILTGLSTKFYSMTEENKAFDFINVESRVANGGGIEFVGYYQIGINPANSLNKSGILVGQTEFGPTDYWKPYRGEGKCGPYEGQCIGRDAATELTRVGKNCYSYKSPVTGVRVVWTEMHDVGYINGINGHYLLDGGYGSCIDPDQMNYYLKTVMNEILEYYIPNDCKCKILKVIHDIMPGVEPLRSIVHLLNISFGKPIMCPEDSGSSWKPLPQPDGIN